MNPNYALGYLLQAEFPAKMGTSRNFGSLRSGDYVCGLKSRWSTHFHWARHFRNENPMHNSGLVIYDHIGIKRGGNDQP